MDSMKITKISKNSYWGNPISRWIFGSPQKKTNAGYAYFQLQYRN